jgi:hypothetical protein
MYSNKYDAILEGFLDLIDIQLTPTSLAASSSSSSSYKDVKATFCKLDWALQQRNPSLVPMFRDLQSQSQLCHGTLVTVDLYDIVQKAKLFTEEVMAERNYADPKIQQQEQTQQSKSKNSKYDGLRSIPPTGVVFHQTRCGSTLVANLLAGFAPTLTKVYSESPPPLKAISACSSFSSSTTTTCNTQAHIQLIQDVFYLMGRTNRPEQPPQHVFYKIQSIGVHSIHAFTQAFPETPWIFLYRDAIEVMQSHLGKKDEKNSGAAADSGGGGGWAANAAPVCGRNYGRTLQPPMTVAIVTSKGRTMQDVTKTEYCAAHLAGLAESAVREMESNANNNKGRFVNYNQLPTIMWESIVPNHFGVHLDVVSKVDMEKRMTDIAQVYSKGRGNKANQEWEEDSTKKQTTARTEVIAAAHVFMEDTYTRLEELSQKQQP